MVEADYRQKKVRDFYAGLAQELKRLEPYRSYMPEQWNRIDQLSNDLAGYVGKEWHPQANTLTLRIQTALAYAGSEGKKRQKIAKRQEQREFGEIQEETKINQALIEIRPTLSSEWRKEAEEIKNQAQLAIEKLREQNQELERSLGNLTKNQAWVLQAEKKGKNEIVEQNNALSAQLSEHQEKAKTLQAENERLRQMELDQQQKKVQEEKKKAQCSQNIDELVAAYFDEKHPGRTRWAKELSVLHQKLKTSCQEDPDLMMLSPNTIKEFIACSYAEIFSQTVL